MILAAYINRQVWAVSLVVTLVLAVILLGGRLIMYLSYAAEGKIVASAVFQLLIYRSPEFFQMILPLGFFLGVLLSIGRMSLERELAVIESAGIGLRRIAFMLVPTFVIMGIIVGALGLYVSPWGYSKTDIMMQEQRQRADFETLAPGKFHRSSKGQKVTYAQELTADKSAMQNLFITELDGPAPVAVLAEKGRRVVDPLTGVQKLVLTNGRRYQVNPGESEATVIEYDQYQVKISEPDADLSTLPSKGQSTAALMANPSFEAIAELHWRLSLPLLAPSVLLIALPLSRVNPRQGRFWRLFPAIGLYFVYLGCLVLAKSAIEEQGSPFVPSIWIVHLLMMCLGVFLFVWPNIKLAIVGSRRRSRP